MDKLLHTSLYRAILKSLNRKATSEKRLQTYFFEFANEITIICNNTEYLSVLHTLNYTQIQFQYLLFRLPELSVPPPPYVSRFILKALEFIRLEKELLYYRLEHPRLSYPTQSLNRHSIGQNNIMQLIYPKYCAPLTL